MPFAARYLILLLRFLGNLIFLKVSNYLHSNYYQNRLSRTQLTGIFLFGTQRYNGCTLRSYTRPFATLSLCVIHFGLFLDQQHFRKKKFAEHFYIKVQSSFELLLGKQFSVLSFNRASQKSSTYFFTVIETQNI